MSGVNTNMGASITINALAQNQKDMERAMERLSTGQRINSASDDAAGLAISSKMTSQIRGLDQAVRNANDAISMIQVAEGAMKEVTNMFQRMRELAVQAISDSNTSNDRTALDNEYKQLSAEVRRIAGNTQWNGTNILDGDRTATTFQVGANAGQTIDVTFQDMRTANALDAGDTDATPLGSLTDDGDATDTPAGNDASSASLGSGDDETFLDGLTITSADNAKAALYALSEGISNVDGARATLGASMSRLEYASDNLQNVSQNASAARSRVLDADYATETTELARTQIIQQAGTAMLSQANQSQQSVLSLLK